MGTWRLVNGTVRDGQELFDLVHNGEYVISGTKDKLLAHAKEHGDRQEWFADGHKSVRLTDIGKDKTKPGKGRRA